MSELMPCKLSLKCSLAVLRRALLNIMPQWEKHLTASDAGDLTIYDMLGTAFKGFSIKIPKGEGTGLRWCDLGFKLGEDGTWSAMIDPGGVPGNISNIDKVVLNEVGKMRQRVRAVMDGLVIATDKATGRDTHILEIDVPVKEKYKLGV
jgi:hypothetical protein